MSIRRKGQEYSLLANCVTKLALTRSSSQAVDIVLENVSELFGGSRCSLVLKDSDETLQVVADHDPSGRGSVLGLRYSVPNSITANVVLTGATANTSWLDPSQSTTHEPSRSFCAIPIRLGSQIEGVLTIDSTAVNAFSAEDEALIEPYVALLQQPLTRKPELTDIHGTLSRLREKQVLVLGKDNGEEYRYLTSIADSLKSRGYSPVLVKEHPDFRELSNEDKVRLFADVSRFVVLENSFPAGQIAECKICSTNRIVTAMLRERNRGSSYMVTDYTRDFDFMEEFVYDGLTAIDDVVKEACAWAESQLCERADYFDATYPWRKK